MSSLAAGSFALPLVARRISRLSCAACLELISKLGGSDTGTDCISPSMKRVALPNGSCTWKGTGSTMSSLESCGGSIMSSFLGAYAARGRTRSKLATRRSLISNTAFSPPAEKGARATPCQTAAGDPEVVCAEMVIITSQPVAAGIRTIPRTVAARPAMTG